jgi:hypothetical protein
MLGRVIGEVLSVLSVAPLEASLRHVFALHNSALFDDKSLTKACQVSWIEEDAVVEISEMIEQLFEEGHAGCAEKLVG